MIINSELPGAAFQGEIDVVPSHRVRNVVAHRSLRLGEPEAKNRNRNRRQDNRPER